MNKKAVVLPKRSDWHRTVESASEKQNGNDIIVKIVAASSRVCVAPAYRFQHRIETVFLRNALIFIVSFATIPARNEKQQQQQQN